MRASPFLAAEVPEEWLGRATDDLRLAEILIERLEGAVPEDERALAAGALFFAQQAAEKAMKAFLVAEGQVPPRTHNVAALAEASAARAPELKPVLAATIKLAGYATRLRYPGAELDVTNAEVAERVEIARTCLTTIRDRLSQT